jgi:N-acetylmuramoyl-L-alanine amidase
MIRSPLATQFILSPNVEARRDNRKPDMLILHYTGMADAARACSWLCNPVSKVSCHYLVDEQGVVIQMVDENLRAWHAGVSSWKNDDDINSSSIGIEIQNPGHTAGYPDFPDIQMQAVLALCKDIVARNDIQALRVLAHSDIAPLRKIDPGEKFDWPFLHHNGIGHLVRPEPIGGGSFLQLGDAGQPVEVLQAMLRLYGYGIDINGNYDALTHATVRAFQLHFRRARVDGIADTSTVATLHRLLHGIEQV